MNYFLFHIGQPIQHLQYCVNNILRVDSNSTIYLCTNVKVETDTRVKVLSPNDLPVLDIKNFLKHDPNPLWYTALIRIFYLNSFLQTIKEPVVHFDNDVLCFYNFQKISKFLTVPGVYMTPHKATEFTFGYSFINDIIKFNIICENIFNLIQLGEFQVKKITGDNIHEMRLLGYCGKDLITKLPVYPDTQTFDKFIFDPSSYGQYIDGTPNGHTPGFIDTKQLIGSLLTKNDQIIFDKTPKLVHNNTEYKIFNLHVHTKNLYKYAI